MPHCKPRRLTIKILIHVCAFYSGSAVAEPFVICGSAITPGSEVTVAQWIDGPDQIAPVIKRPHWRILHRKINGNYCPVVEIEQNVPVYIRAQKSDGSIATQRQFGMYSFDTTTNLRFNGDYQLFLETVFNPDNNLYTWYREPMVRWDDGIVRASPTVGLSQTNNWEAMYPVKNGFEQRLLAPGETSITVD
jgi:hypothetical protein